MRRPLGFASADRRDRPVSSIDVVVADTSYTKTQTGYIADQNRLGWSWKVRARIDGEWGEWSEAGWFDVEPLT